MWEKGGERIKIKSPEKSKFTSREIFEDVLNVQPLRIETTTNDIAYVVNFLSSDEARSITGQSINVNGGAIMN